MTIGVEFGSRLVAVEPKVNVKLQIWDTAGQESFRSITRSYYRGAICSLLVYDITKTKSFENVEKWLTELREHGSENMCTMLIGNKSDLANDRQVQTEEAEAYAEKEQMALLETSALDSSNVATAFECIIKVIYK